MSDAHDIAESLAGRVREAARAGTPLAIVGGDTKSFLGRLTQAQPLPVAGHRGIVAYEPTELVVTARAGTPLADLEAALAAEGQHLAFEPPAFGAGATLGGTVAAGLSGPARPYAGAVRDFVLGARVLTGRGEVLAFGGQVMKNVAGYDVSRLMAGAMGALGVLLDVSLKVLPRPGAVTSVAFECSAGEAIERMNAWAGQPLPLSAACHHAGRLVVRLSGTPNGVDSAARSLGGEPLDDGGWWEALREQRLDFFGGAAPLWRVAVPPATPPLPIEGESLIDWGGALRWLRGEADGAAVRAAATAAGGHATLFRGGDRTGEVFHPLAPGIARLHDRLKSAFDPQRILNPGRMYQGL